MYKLDQHILDNLIVKELEIIQEESQQLRRTEDTETKKFLYEILQKVKEKINILNEERKYLSMYQDFDR